LVSIGDFYTKENIEKTFGITN